MKEVAIQFKNGIRIGTFNFPYRKKPCLGVMKGNELVKYATFNSDESAELFMDILIECLGIGKDGEQDDQTER